MNKFFNFCFLPTILILTAINSPKSLWASEWPKNNIEFKSVESDTLSPQQFMHFKRVWGNFLQNNGVELITDAAQHGNVRMLNFLFVMYFIVERPLSDFLNTNSNGGTILSLSIDNNQLAVLDWILLIGNSLDANQQIWPLPQRLLTFGRAANALSRSSDIVSQWHKAHKQEVKKLILPRNQDLSHLITNLGSLFKFRRHQ